MSQITTFDASPLSESYRQALLKDLKFENMKTSAASKSHFNLGNVGSTRRSRQEVPRSSSFPTFDKNPCSVSAFSNLHKHECT